MKPSPLIGLFAEASAEFERQRAEAARYGLVVDPATELRSGGGLLCYYDLNDGHIYLSMPDPTSPIGAFQAIIFRNLLGMADDEEFAALIRLHLPWLLAHELGHYFRHQRGQFGQDLWFEEQVANQFAAALTEHRLDPASRATFTRLLRKSLTHLAPQVGATNIAVASFLDPVQALGATGVLRRGTLRSLELVQELLGHPPEEVLRGAPSAAMAQREDTIEVFNSEYTSGLARYVYLQYGWLLIELDTPERPYVDGVARQHLNLGAPTLPAPAVDPSVSAEAIAACFFAHRALADRGGALSRYFFKRYRALLLTRIEEAITQAGARSLQVDLRCLIDAADEDELAALDVLSFLAAPDSKALFPAALALAPEPPRASWVFPEETDRRLFALSEGAGDLAASVTLARLEQLERSEVYRGLSAELLVELAAVMQRILVQPGEALIWQGSDNDDVYLIVAGNFEVLVERGGQVSKVGELGPGAMAGELAFLRGEPRAATLRASEPSECLVIRSTALRVLSYEHPALPMRLARMLARQVSR